MAVSALQSVLDNTVALIEGITPTAHGDLGWRYLDPTRTDRAADDELPGRDRTFVVGWSLVEKHDFVGAGQERLEYLLEVATSYGASDADDMMHSDRVDLIAALEPAATYASGTWGALKARWLAPLTEPAEIEGTNRAVVVFEVHVLFDHSVSNV